MQAPSTKYKYRLQITKRRGQSTEEIKNPNPALFCTPYSVLHSFDFGLRTSSFVFHTQVL